jgi:hypothetical protein
LEGIEKGWAGVAIVSSSRNLNIVAVVSDVERSINHGSTPPKTMYEVRSEVRRSEGETPWRQNTI